MVLIPFASISQGSSVIDSCTCIPNSQLRNAAKKNEEYKALKLEMDLTRQKIRLLEMRIAIKDSINLTHDSLYAQKQYEVNNLDQQVANLKSQLSKTEAIIKGYRKNLVRTRVKFWTFGSITLAAAVTTVLLIK